MKPFYFCEGDIRGKCPHKHRTRESALKCLDKDSAGCQKQGGYSDRELKKMAMVNGVAMVFSQKYWDNC